jgi:hypothetical protein
MSPAAYAAEELPAADMPSRLAPSEPMPPGSVPSNPFSDDSGPVHDYGPAAECGDNYCGDDYCCDDYCGDVPCGTGFCSPCNIGCTTEQWFLTADYIYARASFSDSVGFLNVDSQGLETDQQVTQLEFDYESSFRVGGGYRLCGCGDEIRFMYTRLESFSVLQQDGGTDSIFLPYVGEVVDGFEAVVGADVEINSYELEYAKTIPLGGGSGGCGCGDGCGCGCGDCCGSCPAWDVRWSGGFRAADAEWQRAYGRLTETSELDAGAVSSMDFDGAGLKVGLEGRRYFCHSGWLSVYAKGDLSLLYGQLDFNVVRTQDNGTAPDVITQQSTSTEQIIPVTDLEAGVSAQISCNGRMSAGYLLSAWHDLGFRDEIQVNDDFPVQYDDANILGFDGFFARLEYGF